jgi:calcium-binding protein CML
MAGYPPPGSGYPYGPGASYGSSPAPSAPPYGNKPPKEGKTSSSSAPYYGAPPSTQPLPYGGYGAPPGGQQYGAPPPSSAPYGAPPPSSSPYGAPPYGAPPPASSAPGGYGSMFAALVPSAFPPGTDPTVVACFQAADSDGSGTIDGKELQAALSGYNQSFSLRTVHLLMYLFTNTNVRRIGKPHPRPESVT